ncbi:MAG: outer membrane lipoprotein-sorting protein [Spirochaetae bacterium HGW-Spirochaetae-7]|jgi:outer membrane lipoprotein-sorting protein|nr:MAG: outer membrane lipoprotein-sorting protein [Spirochaetae bacterium HGW-Spirochaetae-7]
MSIRIVAAFCGSAAFALLAVPAAHAEGPDAREMMRLADEAMYPPSFSMTATITTERPGRADSTMTIEIFHKADVGTFMEVSAPARMKGTRFLQTDDALYMYSPRAGSRSSLRLSPRESFQGSVFSNNDVGDSTWANDYEPAIEGSKTIDHPEFGRVEVWLVSGTALRRDVPYGSIRIYLSKDRVLPLRMEYFAKSGLLLKTMELSGYANSSGRLRPTRLAMTDENGTGERSVVVIGDLRVRTDLPDAMFNQAWLTR